MAGRVRLTASLGVLLAASVFACGTALANGGPFVIKYPEGDPAAKGTVARLDPDLKPARETRLQTAKICHFGGKSCVIAWA
ncbi:MAG TPA: hypothetical protein VMX94_03750 [Armatimonadota bacterium]|nr:hypothetical protein [Armatimonadota bacterium]